MSSPVSYIARQSIVRPVCGRLYGSLLNGGKCAGLLSTLQNHSASAVVYTIPCRTLVRKPERFDIYDRPYKLEADMRDRIPPGYKIAYVAPLKLYMRGVSVMCVALIVIFGYALKTRLSQYMKYTDLEEYEELLPLVYDPERLLPYILLGVSMFGIAVILYQTRNILLRLYYNKQSNDFIAVIRKYALYNYQLNVKPSDVKVVQLFTSRGQVEVHKKCLTVAERGFLNSELYDKFMGYSESEPRPRPKPVKRGIFSFELETADNDGEREPEEFKQRLRRTLRKELRK